MATSGDGADVCRWKRFLNKLLVAGDAPANEHVDSVAALLTNSRIPRPEHVLGIWYEGHGCRSHLSVLRFAHCSEEPREDGSGSDRTEGCSDGAR